MRLIFNLTHNSRANPIEYFFGYLKGKVKDEPYGDFKTLAQKITDCMHKI